MSAQDNVGAVTFRTANSGALGIKASARLIFDSQKRLMLPKWGVQEDLPMNSGQTIQFRRYHNIDIGLNPIFGTTNPSAVKMSWSDFSTTLYRYGGVVDIPDHKVHDGEKYQHEPAKLNVIIEAPIEAMNAVLEKHLSVRNLCDNEWIHLLAMDGQGKVSRRYIGNLNWEEISLGSD